MAAATEPAARVTETVADAAVAEMVKPVEHVVVAMRAMSSGAQPQSGYSCPSLFDLAAELHVEEL